MNRIASVVVAVVVLAIFPVRAVSDLLIDSGGDGTFFVGPNTGGDTIGYDFIVGPSQLRVTSLGIFDLHAPGVVGNGLTESHQVGLWDDTGTLLGEVTVPAGTVAPLFSGFRFWDLSSPITLVPGETYVLGAHYLTNEVGSEALRANIEDEIKDSFPSEVTLGNGRIGNLGFKFPNFSNVDRVDVGPNLIFSIAIAIAIDIKPGSDPNCFNINGHGVVPVAVLGSDTFDVTLIDQSSLLFGGLEARVRGKKDPVCNVDDSNGDVFLDLVCHFEDDAESWVSGDGEATLTGMLLDGTEFEGIDSICVKPKKHS